MYRELLAYRRKSEAADSITLGGTLGGLGECLLQQRKHTDAERVLREALDIHEKKTPDMWPTFNIRSAFGRGLARTTEVR